MEPVMIIGQKVHSLRTDTVPALLMIGTRLLLHLRSIAAISAVICGIVR